MIKPPVKQNNFRSILFAMVVFVLIIIIVPFYESKRIILWTLQNEGQRSNIFKTLALEYAVASDTIKKETKLNTFFDSEYHFWVGAKESPFLFQVSQPKDEKNLQVVERSETKTITGALISKLNDGITPPQPSPAANNNQADGAQTNNTLHPSSQGSSNLPAFTNNKLYTLNYLIMGDSFMAVGGELGDVIEGSLSNGGDTKVYGEGIFSSGLSRPDYFNWDLETQKLISLHTPDVAMVIFGANDNQNLADGSGNLAAEYGTQAWADKYATRVDAMLDIFKENNVVVFWVGLPIMRESWFSNNVSKLDAIYQAECQKYQNAYFIPTWTTLANAKGNYSDYLKDNNGINIRARNTDGIHVTYFGGTLMTREIFKNIEEVLK